MPLTRGTRLGPYEIVTAIGAGGMGEVYRARDTQLKRDVAIKVLPEIFAADPDRLSRFEREATTLASLNHPNIAQIYGVVESPVQDEHDGPRKTSARALVMELVPGETLADRLARGPLTVDETLAVARDIAAALEAAHEAGVVHRDLKPANIKIRDDGTVKVLDFGLAKALDPARASDPHGLASSPTFTSPALTQMGVILGTAAYMSPEQAKGRTVDKRADIWAFGCILYEMLSARSPFEAETVTETLGLIVARDVDMTALPASVPRELRTLMLRCLEKDPRRRLRDIGDAQLILSERGRDDAAHPATRSAKPWRSAAIALAAAVLAAGMTWIAVRPAPVLAPQAKRFVLSGVPHLLLDPFQALAISPDGQVFAFRGRGPDAIDRIYIRRLDGLEAASIPGTEGGRLPFFSPDGRWLGFFAAGSLRRISVTGGAAQSLATVSLPAGGTWMDDGSIVFADATEGLQRIPPAGGPPELLLALDQDGGGEAAAPSSLPGSRALLLMVRRGGTMFDVALFRLADRTVQVLAQDGSSPVYAATGHVVFHQENSLMALPFDLSRLAAAGTAFPVMAGMGTRMSYQTRLFALAGEGTLIYVPAATGSDAASTLTWVDPLGEETAIARIERAADMPRLSPDGTRIAFRTPATNCDIWVHDIARGTTMRLTREGDHHGAVWTPDGARVATARSTPDRTEILLLSADGSGAGERLARIDRFGVVPTAWLPTGALLVQVSLAPTSGADLFEVTRDGGAVPVLNAPFDGTGGVFSPDGRLVAYVSDETGRREVYVKTLSGDQSRIQVSVEGGMEPVWSPSGRELFFRNGRDFLAADVEPAPLRVPGRPRTLFTADYAPGPLAANYDVTRDRRVIVIKSRQWGDQPVIVLNWFSEWNTPGSGSRRSSNPDEPTGGSPREMSHAAPVFLPDGNRFLFIANTRRPDVTNHVDRLYAPQKPPSR